MSSDMSAESKNVPTDFADRLASFDDMLHATSEDVEMLADIQSGIGELLKTDGSSEAQIRRVLQERYEAGALRKETYQLVKSMLDHFVSETIPTSPTPKTLQAAKARKASPIPLAAMSVPAMDKFSATTTIPVKLAPKAQRESQVQVGSVLRDRFMLQEEVSGGSMGVVYKALDRRLAEAGSKDHWVAIKVLSPQLAENGQALRALQQEAAKGRCLVHPNIVRFIDLDREDDLYFLVMEWLDGRTLAEILDSRDAKIIDQAAAFRIVRQIGEALDYAHRCGIVHADIKPGNIMIMPNGDAKLFDFGVARMRQQQIDSDFDPGVLGAITPAYSSLQVLTGEEPVASDDVFSLCCLFYRLIAGYRVFGPRDAAEASQEGMSPQRLKGLNDNQWRTIKKGLAYARIMRFASVREFLDQLGDDIQLSDDIEMPLKIDIPDHFEEPDQSSKIGKTLLVLLLVLGLSLAGAYQYGYLQPLIDQFSAINDDTPVLDSIDNIELDSRDPLFVETPAESLPEERLLEEAEPIEVPLMRREELAGPSPMLVDFSKLPAATHVISFTHGRKLSESLDLAMREDDGDVIIDFVRSTGLGEPILLRLEEVGFSGRRSPWVTGELSMSNSGLIELPAGQERGRITLSMASDNRREADQQSTLRLRDAEFVNSEIAILNITLEDDDQRAIESQISANVVGLTESQMTVSEADPAVLIELIRFNPNEQPLDVGVTVINLTAKEGSDFFKPGGNTVSFGPRERTARLLIPLVQDSEVEGDEAFILGLTGAIDSAPVPVIREVIIMIEDDDLQE
jgi:serine/threonine protein kinase